MQQFNCCTLLQLLHVRGATNSPDLSPVDYKIWLLYAASCLYHRQIHSVDGLKRRLINVWCGLEQSILIPKFLFTLILNKQVMALLDFLGEY